jgi:transketolase
MGSTMVGMAAHGGGILAARVLRVPFDRYAPTSGLVAVTDEGPFITPTTWLASAKMAPRTSRSSSSPHCGRSRAIHVIRPADANETAQRRDVVEHDGPRRLSSAARTSRSSRRLGSPWAPAWYAAYGRHARPVIVGTGSEVAVCVHAAETLAERGSTGREHAELGPLRAARRTQFVQRCSQCAPEKAVEAAVKFGWERHADDSVSMSAGVKALGNVASKTRHRRPCRRALRAARPEGVRMTRLQQLARARSEPVARQPQAQLSHVR